MAVFTYDFSGLVPVGTDPANALADYIRNLVKKALLERFSLEHISLDSAEVGADDSDNANAQGRHKAGVVGTLYVGTTAEIAALSGMGEGAICFNTDTGYFRYYSMSSGWTNVPVVENPLVAGDGIQLVGVNNAVSIGAEVPVPGVAYSIPYALTDAASVVIDASKSNVFTLTLTGNRALANPSNLKTGCSYVFIIKQDATGSRTLSYGSTFTFADSITPILSTGANAVDMLSCVYDGSKLRCVMINNFG